MSDGSPSIIQKGRAPLPIGEAIRFGWTGFCRNFGFLVGLGTVVGISLVGIFLTIAIIAQKNEALSTLLGMVVQFATNTILPVGAIAIALKICDQVAPKWEDCLCPIKTIVYYFVGSLIYGMFVFVGLLLLIVPGVYFGIRFCLMGYFVVDLGLDPIEAIKRSWEATRGRVVDLLIFGFIMGLINIAGVLALFVGIFVTAPVTLVAGTYIYRFLGKGPVAKLSPSQTAMS